ncbi:septum formation family protein [Mycolicibacterium sp.]|uniref:septum formation family protein n=1 Tax=Mycolicibacterium sp. TaxID=2320850 RepID=UPI001A30433D|nr:septum formation family protein [Mycolicibacterium sp.]MBJ7340265.1 septum formation family protein [Mycolicibacterium sp.]
MTWPSGDPNQPPAYGQPGPQYPPPPPPLPYQQGQYGPAGQYGQYGQPAGGYQYPEPPKKKSRKGLFIGLGVLAVVLLGGLAAAVVFFVVAAKDKVIATDLAVGDCLTDIPDGSLVQLVPKTDCSQPHAGEAYAVLTMPDGDYPGQATISEWQNRCPGELESYSPDAMTDDSIGVFVLYPTAETWGQGDRAVVCIATTDVKRTGSLKK